MNAGLQFEQLDLTRFDWDAVHAGLPDRMPYQTSAWLKFLSKTQRAEPVVAALKDGQSTVGYFSGLIVCKFGLKILGSPFKGWSTDYMGFNLSEGIPRQLALQALRHFAFHDLGCLHMEGMDRRTTFDDVKAAGLEFEPYTSWEIDLALPEEKMFSVMRHSCRSNIRKAERVGVQVEEACGLDFADDYYNQLQEVFAKKSLVPTYSAERVRELIRTIGPTGMLLLLRARHPEGCCVATAIFIGLKETAFAWGAASLRKYQVLRPNELLTWHAIKYWKSRGAIRLDYGGGGAYKQKFGATSIALPWFRKSRYPLLEFMRSSAQRMVTARQRFWGNRTVQSFRKQDDSPESSDVEV